MPVRRRFGKNRDRLNGSLARLFQLVDAR